MNIDSFRIIDSLSHEKTFSSPFALAFELRFRAFHLSVKLYFPFSFGKTNISLKIICPLLFVFYSKITFFYSIVKDLFAFALRMLVGLDGLEPSTSRLSGARSSHLSYKPEFNS